MRARGLLTTAALAALAIGFWVAPTYRAGPPRDFEAYYAAGATWLAGHDPYSRDVWQYERRLPGVDARRDELLPYVGPPYALPPLAVVSLVPFSVASTVWRVLLGLCFVTFVLACLKLAGRDAGRREALAALAAGAAFGPLSAALALGQLAAVSCAALALTLVAYEARSQIGLFAGTLATALQPNLALPLTALLRERGGRLALAAALVTLAVLLLLTAGGSSGVGHYVRMLVAHARVERFLAIQTTPAAVVRALGFSTDTTGRFAGGLAAFVFGVLALQVTSPRYDAVAGVALACAALPLALPFAHEHDLAVTFLPALLCLRRARGIVWLGAALGTLLVATNWLLLAQVPGSAASGVALALCLGLALAVLAPGALHPLHFVPLLVVALIVPLGGLAAQHPLPV
ncbi:MAG TPA: glycosyltransferase 87 family protein, partial [Candidatus Baltobacteraceae bacterium]|nr:glycosyltransferase 87 family protein [Candidatus Baltobacteraceae bacterium]